MKRKGIVIGELLVTLVFVVLVIGVGIFIVYKFMKGGTEGIDNFQQCEGLIGTLSGKKGSCFIDKGCTQPFSADGKPTAAQQGAVASDGKRWQYIGAGFGCKESTYCCIELGENENPVSANQIGPCPENSDEDCKNKAAGTTVTKDENGKNMVYTCTKKDGLCRLTDPVEVFKCPETGGEPACKFKSNGQTTTKVESGTVKYFTCVRDGNTCIAKPSGREFQCSTVEKGDSETYYTVDDKDNHCASAKAPCISRYNPGILSSYQYYLCVPGDGNADGVIKGTECQQVSLDGLTPLQRCVQKYDGVFITKDCYTGEDVC